MTTGTLLALAGLALVDSTSIGTLLVPLWIMLNPRTPVSRFLTYLATVAGFYFAVGVLLVVTAGALQRALTHATDNAGILWAQLVVGGGLFALSFRYDPKRLARRRLRSGRPDRATRWRNRAAGDGLSTTAVVTLGLAAAGLEVMTMLPYLAAVGIITAAEIGPETWLPLLLGYVLVMVLPALVLFLVRTVARRRVEPVLNTLTAWMSRHSAEALGWVLAVVGLLLAADAVSRLHLIA